jgi:hypothetical protein
MIVARKLVLAFSAIATAAWAGPKLSWNDGQSSLEFQQVYQLWSAYTFDPAFNSSEDARLDFLVRRARWTFKGQAAPDINYQVQLAADALAKDPLSTGVQGTAQYPTTFQALDVYATWTADTTWANLTVGLFRPVLSRELFTSPTSVVSLDNTLTYSYLRDFLFTRSTAREGGADLGGFWYSEAKALGASYDLGIFDASQEKNASTLKGSQSWSPLVTGRLALTVGDPESKTYKPSYSGTSNGKRKGLTLAAYGSWQGNTSLYVDSTVAVSKSTASKAGTTTKTIGSYVSSVSSDSSTYKTTLKYAGGFDLNTVVGADLQAEWAGFVLNAEGAWMHREFSDAQISQRAILSLPKEFDDYVWNVRVAYGFPVAKTIVEPAVSYSRYEGDVNSVLDPDGEDQQWDVGVNWYPSTAVKVSLHYVGNDGKGTSAYTTSKRDDTYTLALQLSL